MSTVSSVLISRLGESYASLLGIRLADMGSDEGFKWFVAAILLGSPMSVESALTAYRTLESSCLLEPRLLASVDEESLIEIIQGAGVNRVARRTVDTLLFAIRSIVSEYDADINRLHFFARNADDLIHRLRKLGRTVPHRAINLFLAEMRYVWDKAPPGISSASLTAACRLGIVSEGLTICDMVDQLHMVWERTSHAGRTYADFEAALLCLGESFCKFRRCKSCPMRRLCARRGVDAGDRLTSAGTTGSMPALMTDHLDTGIGGRTACH